MNIADLYVTLGIKDPDKLNETLKNIRENLKGVSNYKSKVNNIPIGLRLPKVKNPMPSVPVGGDSPMPNMPLGEGNQKPSFWNDFQKKIRNANKAVKDFFNIRGSGKTSKSIASIADGMQNIRSLSLGAKAAIIGVIYQLDKLFKSSAQRGTDLLAFETLLGAPSKALQQFQRVGRQAGLSDNEMEEAFKSISSRVGKLYLGTGPGIEFWNELQRLTHEFSTTEILDFIRHPERLFSILQEYARKQEDPFLRKEVISGIVGERIAAPIIEGRFTKGELEKTDVISDEDLKRLDQTRRKLQEASDSVSTISEILTSALGPAIAEFVSDVLGFIKETLKDIRNKLQSEGKNALKSYIQHMFTGVRLSLWQIEGLYKLIAGTKEEWEEFKAPIIDIFKTHFDIFSTMFKELMESGFFTPKNFYTPPGLLPPPYTPSEKSKDEKPTSSNVYHINQNLNFNAPVDANTAQALAQEVKKQLSSVMRQTLLNQPSLVMGS